MTRQEFVEQFEGEIAINQLRFPYHPYCKVMLRRGTSIQCAIYVGKLNELVYSTDDKTFHLCDGETPGGIIHLKLVEA